MPADSTNYWIGANDLDHEGDFVWKTSGEVVTLFYPHGTHGQPDNQGGVENCVSLRKVYPGNGVRSQHEMNDEICSLKFATLCEE